MKIIPGYKIMHTSLFKNVFMTILAVLLSSCGDNAPEGGPDLSAVAEANVAFFTKSYNQCNINNTMFDCNCIARLYVDHRSSAYSKYENTYESDIKFKLETDILTLSATLEEKTKNHSDPRIIENMAEDLARLKARLTRGLDDIDNFEMPLLPTGTTEQCKLNQNS